MDKVIFKAEVMKLRGFLKKKFQWFDGRIEDNYLDTLYSAQEYDFIWKNIPYSTGKAVIDMIEWDQGRPWS